MESRLQELEQENAKLREQLIFLQGSQRPTPPLPDWFIALRSKPTFRETLDVREWKEDQKEWRNSKEGGWLGNDYVHSPTAGVRVLEYQLHGPVESSSSGSGTISDFALIGPAFFTENSESHKGLCHGGSMCSLMDDVVGWLGFCSSGELKAWEGFTVQIDTSLKKPVQVGSMLRVEASIIKREGARKVYIAARLTDPNSAAVHCECNGLFLMPPATSKS